MYTYNVDINTYNIYNNTIYNKHIHITYTQARSDYICIRTTNKHTSCMIEDGGWLLFL